MSKRKRRQANIFDLANNNNLADYWEYHDDATMNSNDMTKEEVNKMLHNLCN